MKLSDFLIFMQNTQTDIYTNLVSKDPTYTKIIEISFEIFESFLEINLENNKELSAYQNLVARTHETLQSIILLNVSGLSHSANMLIREIVEIGYLFEYFEMKPENFEHWLNSDNDTRKKEYQPWQLRKKIAQGNVKLKETLDADYKGHSELTIHITPNSIAYRRGYALKSKQVNYDKTLTESIFTDIAHHVIPIIQIVSMKGKELTKDIRYDKKLQELEKPIKDLQRYMMISSILAVDRFNSGLNSMKS